jgi:hypothetical protein
MYFTTGFLRESITDLCVMIHAEAMDGKRPWPPILGLRKSVIVALTYMRRNRVQAELAETYGAGRANVELCFTPTSASWANPIEAHFGPLRTFVIGGSDYPNHTVLARRLQDYLRWRNAHARHPDVLAAQRRERARIRSERQQRWGRPKSKAA